MSKKNVSGGAMNYLKKRKPFFIKFQKNCCMLCGCKFSHNGDNGPSEPSFDHIIPITFLKNSKKIKRGRQNMHNTYLACRDCNAKRGNKLLDSFLESDEKYVKMLTRIKELHKYVEVIYSRHIEKKLLFWKKKRQREKKDMVL